LSVLSDPVLVLNSGFTPIHIKSVRDAISDVFLKSAHVIEHADFNISHSDGTILSTSYMNHDWDSWKNASRFGISMLRNKSIELQEESAKLRLESNSLIDQKTIEHTLAKASLLENMAKANHPRVLKISCGLEVRGPDVIRLVNYYEVPELEIRLTRRNLMLRDNSTCQYCNKKVSSSNFSIDHVMPKSRGGKGSWENLVVACLKCNITKRDRTPKEAGFVLISKPSKPKWYPLTARFSVQIPPSWNKFLPHSATVIV